MNQVSESHRKLAVFAAAVAVSCAVAWFISAAEAPKDPKGQVLVEQYVAHEKFLRDQLGADALWGDAGKKDELLGYLKTVAVLRVRSPAPVLVGRIAYDPKPVLFEDRPRTLEEQYPVYYALREIGLPAVPHMMDELKKTNPKDGVEMTRLKHALIVACVRDIYEQGGCGTAIVRRRLELELAETRDERAKASLEAALLLRVAGG